MENKSPPKPWEEGNTNSSSQPPIPPPIQQQNYNSINSVPYSSSAMGSYGSTMGGYGSTMGGYGGYGSTMGGYGGYGGGYGSAMGGYGGYGSTMGGYGSTMGGYGGNYGAGYSPYGHNRPFAPESASLSQTLEQSTQRTFQTLQQIVQAFGGFAQMLESTFFATHSSFMAMVGVAEQFGNLKNYLGQVISFMSIYTAFRNMIYKILGRRIPVDPSTINTDSFIKMTNSNKETKCQSKPFWIFLGFVVGIPWLISILLKKMNSQNGKSNIINHPSQFDFAKAMFDFNPSSPAELKLAKGQIVAVLEKLDGGWWRGRSQAGEIGFFPANHVEIIEKTPSPNTEVINSLETTNSDVDGFAPFKSNETLTNELPGAF